MSGSHEIEQLKAQHANLETALEDEERKPQPDHLALAGLKKQKLLVKDQLTRLDHV